MRVPRPPWRPTNGQFWAVIWKDSRGDHPSRERHADQEHEDHGEGSQPQRGLPVREEPTAVVAPTGVDEEQRGRDDETDHRSNGERHGGRPRDLGTRFHRRWTLRPRPPIVKEPPKGSALSRASAIVVTMGRRHVASAG